MVVGRTSRKGSGSAAALVVALCLVWAAEPAAQEFKCTSAPNATTFTTCRALVDYLSPNSTTLGAIQARFNVTDLGSLLGANDLPTSTPPTYPVPANATLKIPFPCRCNNGTGISDRIPVYTVVPGDGLDHIAVAVFSRLVTYQQIQAANHIKDANMIDVGQKLWIPLPCSCDPVGGVPVVHYGLLVPKGSSVEGIAHQYNTTPEILYDLNGLAGPNDLKAGVPLDVPLKACTSMVNSSSLDYPLLVANGTYVYTANHCVQCSCNASNSWNLQCVPSHMKPSNWSTCPAMTCQGAPNLAIGDVTSGCNGTSCVYAGYSNQSILTTTALEGACPASGGKSWGISSKRGSWLWVLVVVHVLFSLQNFVR